MSTAADGSSNPRRRLINSSVARALPGPAPSGGEVVGRRHVTRCVLDSLVGVETNPGPGRVRRGRRGVGLEHRRDRTRRRHERRRERRRLKNERMQVNRRTDKHERKIVTWNLRNVSLREENRRRLRDVCERIEREGWEIVLVQELSAVGNGVIWLGEGVNRVALIHSLRVGIILRGSSLDRWIRDGEKDLVL